MRVPDRPWADVNADGAEFPRSGWDHRARSDELAERLARLAAWHPSADVADPDDPSLDDEDFVDLDPRGRDHEESALDDDLESGGADLGDGPDKAAAAGFRPRHSADSSHWTDPGGKDRGPYRPWFSADGASDPWFAEPTDSAAP